MIDCTVRRFSLFALLAASAAAQRTWIVDAQNRPGADFTDLQPAVAAANDGDAIHLRGTATYNPVTTSKGISILGETGVYIAGVGPIVIENLPAGRVAVVKGLAWNFFLLANPVIVRNCRGRVHLDRLSSPTPGAWSVAITSSTAVSLSGCAFSGIPAVQINDSTVAIVDSVLRGRDGVGVANVPGYPAIAAERARVWFARGELQGGHGARYFNTVAPAPAIVGLDSALVVAGDAATILRAGIPVDSTAVNVVRGTGGTLRIDPHVVLETSLGAPPIGGTIAVTTEWLPALLARGAAPGQVVHADLFSAPGDLALFLTSLAAPPVTVSPGNDLWLDPLLFFVTGVALVDATGHVPHDLPLSPDPNLSFGAWTLQAVGGTFAGGFKLSNPVTYALH